MESRPTIGVLAPLLGGEYFGTVLEGIRGFAAEAGARVIAIQTLDFRLGDEHQAADFMAQVAWDRIDGVITVINAVDPRYLSAVRAAGKPVVMISHEMAGFACPIVVPDNRGGARAAITHLIEHGHRAIAFAGNRMQQDIQERWEAYCDTLRENGIEPDPALTYDTVVNMEEGGEQVAHAMMAAGLPSTAVFVATDYNAIGMMAVLTAAGYELPRDQAFIGFDNTLSGAHQEPTLSSVNQHFSKAGDTAAHLLLDLIAGRAVRSGRHEVAAAFIARESCGCASTASFAPGAEDVSRGAGERLVHRLCAPFASGTSSTDANAARELAAAAGAVIQAFGAAARGELSPTVATLTWAAKQIARLCPDRESFIAVMGTAQEISRELAVAAGPDDTGVSARLDACLLEFSLALLETQLRAEYSSNNRLRGLLSDEYDVSLALLQRDGKHPQELAWLAGTLARGGCVGVWADDGPGEPHRPDEPDRPDGLRQLSIVGAYGPRDDDAALLGRTLAERSFPPESMLELADGGSDVVFVLPLRTPSRDWGFFAAVGPIGTSTSAGRETYYQWAALLSVVLDHEAVVESLRSQREDLGSAYRRERGLVESIQASEERYALAARATNDGLWDWDLVSGEIFYSARWKAMLGFEEAAIAAHPQEWLDRVHRDDVAGLQASLRPNDAGDITSFEYEHRVRSRGDGFRWMLCRALAVPGAGLPTTRLVGSLTDITDRKELEDRLRQDALYDALTGLPNRTLFLDRLDRAIAHSKRRSDYNFVVLFLDLDGFKVVNDSLGHFAGDNLLIQVAERIRQQLREADTAARFGGDEFAILLNDVMDLDDIPVIVDRLQSALALPYLLEDSEVVVTASIGIAASSTGYDSPEDVLRDSDIAMYRAKTKERGTYATFDVSMHERAVKRMRVESELRHAIDENEFELHYQPIFELGTHRIEALEALVRWRHPRRGLVPPGDFLPIAEETGLIVGVGRLIVEEVCRQLAAWSEEAVPIEGVRVSVNVSNREFWHANFQDHLDASLQAYGVPPEWLNLEITEGVIMHNPEVAQTMLKELRTKGFALHIDDFGTGYSSLDALHRFPIQALKIDQSFVSRLETDRKSRELVRTIVMMGRSLDMDVIAEGIENEEQETILQRLGCVAGQGFLFSRPLPAAAARDLLVSRADDVARYERVSRAMRGAS